MHRKSSARRRAIAKRRRQVLRTSRFEELEDRRVLAAAIWTNPIQPLNVSGDETEHVSPIDALIVINELNVPTFTDPVTGRLPQQVPEPINGPYLDITCDGVVSPLDALIVINALNQGVRGGGEHDGSGMWPQLACSPHLVDGDAFVTDVTRTLTLPNDHSAIEVYFRAPAFDTSSEQMIRDAFEIEVMDEQGRPLSLPFTSQVDAVYNWTEQTGPHAGPSVITTINSPDQDSVATINLGGLPAGTKVKATARLVNNDDDGTSEVVIRGFMIADAPTPPPAGASFSQTRPSGDAAVEDFSQLTDLTGSFRPDYGRTTLSGSDDTLDTELTITNLGQQAVTGELIVVLENFTSLDTFVMRPDGFTPAGDPYFNLTPEMQGRPLEPGQTVRSRRIEFLNRSGEQFRYRLKTFGKVNSAPANFSTTPVTVIEAGRTFGYQSLASDADGDPLRYSVETGPESLTIDAASGRVQWVTTADDVGVHQITLTATDPHGLSASQSFSLEVVASLQNRPPNFVTDPVTEAVASSGFEVDTLPGGSQPVDSALVGGPLGRRVVTLDRIESGLSVVERDVQAGWQVEHQISTGDPYLGDSVFDVGYSVDVGLRPWTHSSDANEIEGMDQADLNRDGILDLVVLTWQRNTEEGSTRHEIVSILGDGDGGFGAPTVIASWLPSSAGSDGARNVLIEDFNNDGSLDVVATDRRTRQFIFVAGNGDGSFAPATITDVEYTLSDFRVADVDDDGTLDLIGRTAELGFGANYTLVWLRGNGDGSFGDPQTIGPAGGAPNCCFTERTRAFATGDFNRDGHVDVAVGGHESSIQVYHGDGTGAFTQVFSIDPSGGAFARGPDWMEAADFTGDGNLDIAFYHTWETRVNLLVGDSTGANFTEQINPVISNIDNHAAGPSIADIDGDGDLDIVAALDTVKVLTNDGTGVFSLTHYEMVDFPGHLSDHYPPNADSAIGAMFGDYNRDGVVDLAYMSSGVDFNGVGIRLGTRPGEFGASRGIAGLSNSETDVLPADFNGDGVIDLLSVRASSIMLGRGDGTYDEPFPAFSVGGASGNGSIADFNLDGLPDFVASRSSRYFVGLSNGDGTFTVSDDQQIEGSFYGIHFTDIADFNADGYPDFIAKAGVERTIDVFLNQGSTAPGTFTRTFRTTVSAQGVNVQGFDQALAVGDFNGDARQDFVAVDQLPGEPMKLVFFEGDNSGSFSATQESFVYDDSDLSGFIYSGDLAAGDLNEDGILDLISFTNSGPRIHLGIGDGTFRTTDHFLGTPYSQRGRDGYVVDINGDRHLDIVQAHPRTAGLGGASSLKVNLGVGDGTFLPSQRVGLLGTSIKPLRFADIDHDGHLDVVGPTNLSPATIAVYAGTRDGLVDMQTVDLNADGFEDVLALNEHNDRVKVFLGNALGQFTRMPDLLTGRAPQAVTAVDLDGDGDVEIVTANRAGRSLTVFDGSVESGWTTHTLSGGNGFIDVAAADINGDGQVDLIAIDDSSQAAWVFLGNNTLAPEMPAPVPLGDTPGELAIGDATGDGIPDLAITLPETSRVIVLPGLGNGQFDNPFYVHTAAAASDVAIIDFNADTKPDLVATLPTIGQVSVHYNLGGQQFAKAQLIRVGDSPRRVELGDVDEDGQLDLIVANQGDGSVSVIYSRFNPNEVYRYDADAIDPDGDAITYSVVDGPGGLLIDATTGELLWAASPSQVGVHSVTIAADDGRGGQATQTFAIEVTPPQDNAAPLLATVPPTEIGADEALSYNAIAVDADRDALRYRLLEGPDGARIDPTTGTLHWDGRTSGMMAGRAGQGGDIRVPADPSLKPDSITIEGWFNLSAVRSSGALINDREDNRYLVTIHNPQSLRVDMAFPDPADFLRFFVDISPETDRWYHIAFTYDAGSGTASLFLDGVLAGSATTRPQPLALDPEGLTYVAHNGGFRGTEGTIDNYRIWNYARSAAEVAEGLSRQYESDPRLVLDYRFEGPDTLNVRDHSIYGNTGYRTANGQMPILAQGLADPGQHRFVVGVEDGRGQSDTQEFIVDVRPPVRGSISGHLFEDLNENGVQDDGSQGGAPAEPSLHDWLLFVDSNGNSYPDPSEPQTTTDAGGNYSFADLLPGTYPIRVAPVAGYRTPDPFAAEAVLDIVKELDAANVPVHELAIQQLALSQIRGRLTTSNDDVIANWAVFADLDADGTRDANEPAATSDRPGNFALTGLDAGTYTLLPELPPGWKDTAGPDGRTVTLGADEVSLGNDFVLDSTNTSAESGLHFVTSAHPSIEARQTFRYAALATSITGQKVTYDLSLAPDGMTVDPTTGLVAWRPTIDQLGEHTVILRARDASQSVALQDFRVTVSAPNSSPVVLNEPLPATAFVGFVYQADIHAQDAESPSLHYLLTDGPASATIDSASGRVTWTPTGLEVGMHDFSVMATDDSGASAEATWSVEVRNAAPDELPLAVTLPRTTGAIGTRYFSQVRGEDALGRDVRWTAASIPVGMTIAEDGTIDWTPTANQLGMSSVELTATTLDGTIEVVSFDIEVLGRLRNSAPVITSTPVMQVTLGDTFEYDITASDLDNDVLAYELLEGPLGMSLDASRGTLRWEPAADQLGEHDLSLQVVDPAGRTAVQSFKLDVTRVGGPPRIVSVPPTEASVGTAYLYTVQASDPEGDPLRYELLTSPAGMTIEETTGEISWTPTVDQTGRSDVVTQVVDGVGGAATQAFSIRAADGIANLPPQISSTAPRFGSVAVPYEYLLTATDPELEPVTYSLRQAPAGMTIDPQTGLVSWTPVSGDDGRHVVTLLATDPHGAAAVESFVLDILAENRAPVIQQQTPGPVSAGATFIHDLLARDADLDPLVYELTQAPDGAMIDEFGRIHWQTERADVGAHDFAVRVTDPRGGEATDAFTLVVAEDTVAPQVSVIATPNDADRNILPWMGPFVVFARALDDVAVASLTLSANGQDIPLDAAGTATFTFEDWGFRAINATATAIDTNGNVTAKTITFDYDFPEGWSGAGAEDIPEALISSPTESETVFGMVAISGTASHAEFDSYKLSYRHADDSQFTEIVTSQQAVNDGELGVWDTTMLENDEYVLRLEVATTGGVVNVVERNVGLSGALKLGNFRLSFTDLNIPVNGIPIQVTRTYDTLRADREGEFGYGWRMEFRNADLSVGLPSSGLEEVGIYTPFRPGVKVYMTLPGRERMGWTFTPDIRVLPGFGGNLVLAQPRFTPDPGNTARLQVGSGRLFVNEQGELFAAGQIPWNPASPDFGGGYAVQTKDGLRYRIDGDTGKMTSVTDGNGNTVIFTDAGIESDSGIAIDISRDRQGRITAITDPLGNSVRYGYSPAGDLVSVTDREGNITRFVYGAASPHFLQQVIDPLGRTGVRTEYNEAGRLTRTIDALGSAVTVTYDPENLLVVKEDPLGYPTTYEFDQRGNIVQTTDAYGGITSRTYNTLDLPLTESDPLGRTTKHVYDARGNEISRIDPLGYVTTWTYDSFSVATSQVDALGNTFQATTDPAGNIVSVTTPLGDRLNVAYTSGGVPTGATMEGVGSTAFILKNALPTTVTTSNGAVLNFTYDQNGLPLSVSSIKTGSTGTVTPTLNVTYSANGLVTSIADSEKRLRSYEYDAAGNMVLETDSLGNATHFDYDSANRLTRTLFADGTTVERRYDAGGNLIAIIDQAGRETLYEYDALGRRIATVFPDATPQDPTDNPRRSAEYDAAGQITKTIDELGQVTRFTYDSAGNIVKQIDALGNFTRFEYDAVGNVTAEVDPLGHTTNYHYDQLSRRTATLWPDGTSEHLTLNGRGQVTSRTNGAGETIHYEYDGGGLLTAVVDSLGHRTSYQYNELGELVSVTDALDRNTQYQYDTFGNLVAKQLVTGERETFSYDSAGNLISTTDFNGTTTAYVYDSLQRLVKVQRPDDTIDITYSPTGKPTSIRNHLGTTAFAYDERDRLVQLTQFDSRTINYLYDDAGNIIEVDTPSGVTEYSYDSLNRITSLRDAQNGVTSFAYDAAGNLVRREYPNGTHQAWLYNAVGRVTQIEVGTMTTALERLTYDFDTAGRRTSVKDLGGRHRSFRYDANGRLIAETVDAPGATSRVITYGYDAVGNRIDRIDSASGATVYEYDQRDRLRRESSGGDVIIYEYDANGNRVARNGGNGDVTTYEWTSDNRLRRVMQVAGGDTIELRYEYDGQGHQVIRIQDGAETRFLVDPNRPYSETLEIYDANGAVVAAFVFPPGDTSPLAQVSNGATTYLYGDHLGSTFLATDAAGAVIDEIRYEAFGTVSQRIGTTSIAHLYGGEFRDPTTSLDYLRARVLDTRTGTFLSSDPLPGDLNDPGSLHRFLYVNQDPINHRDPSGEATLAEVLVTSTIVGTLSGTGLGLFYAATGGDFGTGFKRGFAIGFFSASGSILLGRALGGTVDVAFRVGTGSAARFASLAQLSAEGQALVGGLMVTLVADFGLAGLQLVHYFDSGFAEQVIENGRSDRLISGDKPNDVFELGKTLRKRPKPK